MTPIRAVLLDFYCTLVDLSDSVRSSGFDEFARRLGQRAHRGDTIAIGPIALIAHTVAGGRVTGVGLQLAEPDPAPPPLPQGLLWRALAALRRAFAFVWDA